jgi:transcriptional regulator with XRE-family HTH domain
MAREPERAKAGGEALSLAMRRRGLSAPALAEKTGGEVSSSSIRAWINGETMPTARKALATAEALGDVDAGVELLREWGYHDAADGFEAEALPPGLAEATPDRPHPRPATWGMVPQPPAALRLGDESTGTVVGVRVFQGETTYVIRTDTGHLYEARQILGVQSLENLGLDLIDPGDG